MVSACTPLQVSGLRHQHENFQNRKGRAREHVGVGHFDDSHCALETRLFSGSAGGFLVAKDHFLEMLHDQVAEFGHCHHHAVVLLHQVAQPPACRRRR